MPLSVEEIAALEIETEALRQEYTYDNYLLSLRKIPNDALYEKYLLELREMLHVQGRVTISQATQVEARRIWTDVVSETYTDNESYSLKHNVRSQVIQRLKEIGALNPEALYEDCIDFIREETVLTVTFNPSFLSQGLTDYQLLNLYERSSLLKGSCYLNIRNNCEVALAASLSKPLRDRFVESIHARPRYGALKFIDKSILPTDGYGSSFVVLKDVVKFNTLYVPGDSLNYYVQNNRNYQLCTIHHLSLKNNINLLPIACEEGHQAMVGYLLSEQLDINKADYRKETALMCAVRHGRQEVMNSLLAYNPDLNLRNARNENVMDIAFKRHPELLMPLLSHALKEESLVLEQLSSSQMRELYLKCVAQGGSTAIISLFLYELNLKIRHLSSKPKHAGAHHAAEACYLAINQALLSYQKSDKGDIAMRTLMQDCARTIVAARTSDLSHHRGLKNLFVNLALFILLAGVGYLGVVAVSYAKSDGKHFFFQTKTESIKKLDSLEDSLNKIVGLSSR